MVCGVGAMYVDYFVLLGAGPHLSWVRIPKDRDVCRREYHRREGFPTSTAGGQNSGHINISKSAIHRGRILLLDKYNLITHTHTHTLMWEAFEITDDSNHYDSN